MSDSKKITKIYWLNVCMVLPALLLAGATMAFLYLLVPLFFAFVAIIYFCKFSFEIWAWRQLTPEERCNYSEPCRFMNYNFTLSVKMEWFLFWTGFFGLVLWIEYARFINI